MKSLHAENAKVYKINALCALFGRTKQAYFKYNEDRTAEVMAQEAFVVEYVRGIRKGPDKGIGGVKLWRMYHKEFKGNAPIGRDRFEDILDRHGLKIRNRMRKPRTTDSTHGLPTYPDLVRTFIPTAINQLWVSDITYLPIWTSETEYIFCYISLVLDSYSEEIIGYCVGDTLRTEYPLNALEMAIAKRGITDKVSHELIHHSDRGVQYASADYTKLLKGNKIKISMTESGNPKDNAQAERVNSTIKNEMFKGMRFTSLEEVKKELAQAVEFYNTRRPHMSIDFMTPSEAAQCEGELKKHWKSYREKAIKRQKDGDAA